MRRDERKEAKERGKMEDPLWASPVWGCFCIDAYVKRMDLEE